MYVEPKENVLAHFEAKDKSILLWLQYFLWGKIIEAEDKSILLCAQCKIIEEKKSVHPLKLKLKILELLNYHLRIPFDKLIYWFLN